MDSATAEAQKLRGGYYTPQGVAEWLAAWAIRAAGDRVLEPSCGDGVFVEAAASRIMRLRQRRSRAREPQLVGVELISGEAEKAAPRTAGMGASASVEQGDFFTWLEAQPGPSFDVILGNPPFLRYQNFPEPSRTKAMSFMEAQGLHPNRLTNMWVPFVVASVALLRDGGRLAMVVPAELLQVTYAGQLRSHLADSFERITIYACNEMFFDGAEQEVVLVLADGKVASPGSANQCAVSLVETASVDALLKSTPGEGLADTPKLVDHTTEKWLKYFLSAADIEFMRALRAHPDIGVLSDHGSIDVGVVTGKNAFFVLDQSQVDQYDLHEFVVPLVGRSAQLPGAVLRASEHRELVEQGSRAYLLNVTSPAAGDATHEGLRRHIRHGEAAGYHKGYKCSIRSPWYTVPAVWEPDCFFFRQIYDFPRIVVNKARATSTDTIHRFRCPGSPSKVAANLYTHLTAASAEIEGRSYGGGVLELEPTESERLMMPRQLNGAMPITQVDKLVREKRLQDVLDHNDKVVLQGALGLSRADCSRLRGVWEKMRDRRSSRRKRRS